MARFVFACENEPNYGLVPYPPASQQRLTRALYRVDPQSGRVREIRLAPQRPTQTRDNNL